MAFDTPVGTWTVASIAIIVPLLVAGWYLSRGRIRAIAAEHDGDTSGDCPPRSCRRGRAGRRKRDCGRLIGAMVSRPQSAVG
jgi:hypothetical protein